RLPNQRLASHGLRRLGRPDSGRMGGRRPGSNAYNLRWSGLVAAAPARRRDKVQSRKVRNVASHRIDLLEYGLFARGVLRNPSRALLYEDAIRYDDGVIASSGAMVAYSHGKTGRSPKDKRIVDHPDSHGDVWWGPVNQPLTAQSFRFTRNRAVDYLNR